MFNYEINSQGFDQQDRDHDQHKNIFPNDQLGD
jgi:hypothetical protein